MPLDGITARCLARELNQMLAGSRLDRIFQPDRHDIILHFRQGGENLRLILSANPASPRLHITSETRENPSEPPMFCMLLRKHLAGSRLSSVSTPGYERIFQFRFQTTNEIGDKLNKTLVAEIMGRHSNIMLLNQDERIHDSILHVDQTISRVREIMPARIYQLPPSQDKLSPADARELISSGAGRLYVSALGTQPLAKFLLSRLQGFSPLLCQEVLDRAGIDPRLKAAQMSPAQERSLTAALLSILDNILADQYDPSAYYDSDESAIPIDFHALQLQSCPWRKRVASISQAMDLFYLERNRQNTLRQKKKVIEKAISSQLENVRKKLAIHESDQSESRNRDQYRLFGDLILANMNLDAPNLTALPAINYYDESQPVVPVPLRPELSLARNAQHYYKLYAKAQARHEISSRLAENDRQDIAWLESLQNALEMASQTDDLAAVREEIITSRLGKDQTDQRPVTDCERIMAEKMQPGRPGRRSSPQKANRRDSARSKNQKKQTGTSIAPRRYISSDGLTILVGRNNLQNDQLTLKTAQKDDIWLHVQKMPGTHVIVRANRQTVPERTLLEAAEIAAWFSKAAVSLPQYKENFAAQGEKLKIAVDYCPAGHVRKPAGARPGMVIYEQYKTLLVTPKEPQDPV